MGRLETERNRRGAAGPLPAEAGYQDEYSEEGFWTKLGRYAKIAGREVIENALRLFYAAHRPETPMWARSIIYSALGYFILPVDAIPDLTPAIGYADDLGALVFAMATVAAYVSPDVRERARRKINEWFGR
ncbi:MAG: YkvA family protein [Acidobacteriota bacterium]